MFIEDVKVKELLYSGNTVIFLLPNREWSPSQLLTHCSISSVFLLETAFFTANTFYQFVHSRSSDIIVK